MSGKTLSNGKTTVALWDGDWHDLLSSMTGKKVDAIITDPPYELAEFPAELLALTTGNIITFCKPENQFKNFPANEYLFWVKTPSTKNFSRNCGRFVEMIMVRRNGTFNSWHWSQMTGVYDDRLIYPPVHPCEKPLSLIERLIRIYTNPGDVVFDPFMGSGTTAKACAITGRNFIGAEINKQYYELTNDFFRHVTPPLDTESGDVVPAIEHERGE